MPKMNGKNMPQSSVFSESVSDPKMGIPQNTELFENVIKSDETTNLDGSKKRAHGDTLEEEI